MLPFSEACERNKGPILEILVTAFARRSRVLEIGSGTGQHAVHFAQALPHLHWQPTDLDPAALASIAAWVQEAGLSNLRAPQPLDVRAAWPVDRADALFCANMVHISPWACTLGLLEGAARLLDAGAPLVLYGPYRRGGAHTGPSNAAFDESLRARDPAWGVRDLEAVVDHARGFALEEVVEMPANNLTVVLRRS